MADVIIPLAARTSAIVLVNAFSQNCILAQSFNRMVAISRAKWAGQLPFSIVAIVVEVCCLMNNTDENAEWRNVRSKCKPWKARTELMKQLVTKEVEENKGTKKRAGCRFPKERTTHDLDPNSSVYIIVDSISSDEKEIGEPLSQRPCSYTPRVDSKLILLNTALVLWQLTYLLVTSCRPSLSAISPPRFPHLLSRRGGCAGTGLDRDSRCLPTCARSKRPSYLSTCESGPPSSMSWIAAI